MREGGEAFQNREPIRNQNNERQSEMSTWHPRDETETACSLRSGYRGLRITANQNSVSSGAGTGTGARARVDGRAEVEVTGTGT